MASDQILDAKEVAEMLRIHVRTVTRLAEDPDSGLEGFKIGDLWRFYKSDIDGYIQAQKQKAKQQKAKQKKTK
jgi:excisionase family DNA binding protein